MASSQKDTGSSTSAARGRGTLTRMFASTPDATNPRTNVTTAAIRESLARMSTLKVAPKYREAGDELASRPLAGMIALYTPYADAGLKLRFPPSCATWCVIAG